LRYCSVSFGSPSSSSRSMGRPVMDDTSRSLIRASPSHRSTWVGAPGRGPRGGGSHKGVWVGGGSQKGVWVWGGGVTQGEVVVQGVGCGTDKGSGVVLHTQGGGHKRGVLIRGRDGQSKSTGTVLASSKPSVNLVDGPNSKA
jgi:hypothetical protein